LTARATLKKLLKLNRIISVRLALHDSVPHALRHYRVHDGRVTFTVPGEFELDLSVAEVSTTSQFFFVDIRFLFSPSSPIPEGRILNELDAKINDTLRNDSLMGCFNFLHGLVLTNKINILFKQAADLARGLWADALRIELLHRTLVVQYWPQRAGPKSWLEIGVNGGHRSSKSSNLMSGISHLGFRWMREGQLTTSDAIKFDTDDLSMERILRSVVALHTSHLLSAAFTALKKHLLFAKHTLSLQALLSPTEPGDCHLDVQLTTSRAVRISIEPMSGSIILCVTPNVPERLDTDRTVYKSSIEEILTRVARLRCATAVEEIESGTKALGLETVSQRVLGLDPRKLFPPGVMRSAFFFHQLWNRQWVAAATSSMDGDRWWLVQLRPTGTTRATPPYSLGENGITLPCAHVISESLVSAQRLLDYTTCAELVHGLTGILAIHANACYLAELPALRFWPPLKELQMDSDLTVPDLLFSYNPSTLPPALRIALPSGVNRQSQLKEMVRLAFHGIDRKSRSIIMVAHGTLRNRIKSLVPLISKTDPSLITEDKGAGFALRLLVPAGNSVIVGLFERLQRLECVLSILQSLILNGMEPRSLSLSQIAFAYGTETKSSASFDIGVSGPTVSDYVDMTAISKSQPLFRLQLGIKFESSSPHRRIQEALAVALNHRFTETGVKSVLHLMSFTFPLLRSFDQITNLSNQTDSSIVYITVRKPTDYHIHYPRLNSRFRLNRILHQDEQVWMLRDANKDNQSGRGQIATAIREKLYQSKGDGWNGLGDGAVGMPDKVGNLLVELHQCLSAPHLELDKEAEGKAAIPEPLLTKGPVSALPNKTASNQASGLGDTDIITID
jgi:mediator of RNA polymerase II transcription subunit 14